MLLLAVAFLSCAQFANAEVIAASRVKPGLLAEHTPYRLSVEFTPAPFRFRYDTTQIKTQDISSNRSGEDVNLSQGAGQSLMTLHLETEGIWHFSAEQYQVSAANHALLTRKQYLFNRFPITVAAEANAKIAVDSLKISAKRSILETPTGKLGISLGLNVTTASWSLTSTNPAILTGTQGEGTLPLPSLGLFAEHKPSTHTRLKFQTEYFALSHNQTEGRSYYFKGQFEYQPNPTLTLGAGVVHSRLDLNFRMADYMREISLIQGGPYFSLRYNF